MIKYTSSMIVTQARGLEPDGIPATKNGHCAFCGVEINVGNPYVPFSVSGGFTDGLSLACKGSDMTCGWCVHSISADGLRNTGYGVFSLNEGVRPFLKWTDIRTSLLNPPEGIFVMTYATANNQHMAWRAPVNYSRDLFYVRVGLRDLKIRRRKLIEAIDVCARTALAMGRGASSGKTLPHPFGGLSPDLKDVTHASLAWAINISTTEKYAHLKDDAIYQADLAFLQDLTLGETWALRFVLYTPSGDKDDSQNI